MRGFFKKIAQYCESFFAVIKNEGNRTQVLTSIYCLLLGMISEAGMLVGLLLMVWVNVMWFAAKKIKERILLFLFGIAFFTFLLGREFLQRFFAHQVEDFSAATTLHTHIVLLLSLVILFLTYSLIERYWKVKSPHKKDRHRTEEERVQRIERIRIITRIFFYITIVCSIIYAVITVYYVVSESYYYTYTPEYHERIEGNFLLYSLSKMELFMQVALSAFFATMPDKKACKLPTLLYCIYLILSLGSGQRSIVVLGIFWLIIYFTFRNMDDSAGNWISKKIIIALVVAAPFALVFLALFNHWRAGYSASSGVFDGIRSFFYQQGVSVNVIKWEFDFHDQLPSNRWYSMQAFDTGIIARIFGIPVYNGNSLAHATEGFSLAHALGYLVLGDGYLAGHGTGTSYIAELFHDFGYLGVAFGNVILGALLFFCGHFEKNKPLLNTVKLLMITALLWVPRGMYTDFISVILRPSTCVALLVIFAGEPLLALMMKCRKGKKADFGNDSEVDKYGEK